MREMMNLAAMLAISSGGPLLMDRPRSLDLMRDPYDELMDLRRILGTRGRTRRRPTGPSTKRAAIKAARKANVRRLQARS